MARSNAPENCTNTSGASGSTPSDFARSRKSCSSWSTALMSGQSGADICGPPQEARPTTATGVTISIHNVRDLVKRAGLVQRRAASILINGTTLSWPEQWDAQASISLRRFSRASLRR